MRVVIVHWNQPECCRSTIQRLMLSTIPVSITVVDNGSRPEELTTLRSITAEAGVELIEVGTNLGFGPGANRGLARFLADPTDGDWVALVPHDVEPDPTCLERMLTAVRGEPMAGLACADVGDGHVPYIDPYFGGITMPLPESTPDGWVDAAYPHGTLLLARRECLAEIGLFDERYFSYCEEVDLALRARRAGWRSGLIRGARVHNVTLGTSVAVVDYLQQRNTLLLVREMSGRYHVAIRMIITLLQIRAGRQDPDRRPPVFDPRGRLLGIRDFLRGRFGPPPAGI